MGADNQSLFQKIISLSQENSNRSELKKLSSSAILGGCDYLPYSNELCTEIFKALNLDEDNYLSTPLSTFDTRLQKIFDNSWFSITCNSIQTTQEKLNISAPSNIHSIKGYSSRDDKDELFQAGYGKNFYKKSKN
jgi:putative transposase